MGTSRATATVLFTDLVGSTELRTRRGERAAEELRRVHDRLLAEAVEAHAGRVVKGLGDGIMATFAAASGAVAAGVAIQQSVDRHNRRADLGAPLAVRVGISLGDVTFEDDDVHLERLSQLWKEAAAGRRRVAFLAGEPGVGKTRLAAELATGVYEDGTTVLAGL